MSADKWARSDARVERALALWGEFAFKHDRRLRPDDITIDMSKAEILANNPNYDELLAIAAFKTAESATFEAKIREYEAVFVMATCENGRLQLKVLKDSRVGNTLAAKIILLAAETWQSGIAELNANRKKAVDPKQAAKSRVKVLWDDWQAGRALHKSKAAWARYAQTQNPCLESVKVIENWATGWQRERKISQSAS
jgi:hypothetical protein